MHTLLATIRTSYRAQLADHVVQDERGAGHGHRAASTCSAHPRCDLLMDSCGDRRTRRCEVAEMHAAAAEHINILARLHDRAALVLSPVSSRRTCHRCAAAAAAAAVRALSDVHAETCEYLRWSMPGLVISAAAKILWPWRRRLRPCARAR